jgi:uncharacterized protein
MAKVFPLWPIRVGLEKPYLLENTTFDKIYLYSCKRMINIYTSQPVQASDRAQILDVLRGFAILGIFIANSAVFSGYVFLDPSQKARLFTHATDQWISYLYTALVEGKFYSLFSLLFGIGFSIILIRSEQKGTNPLKVFYRRLLILLVFGLGHALLLWDGDILVLYALLSCLLPLFRRLPDTSLLIMAVALLLSPIAIDMLRLTFDVSPGKFLQAIAQAVDLQNGLPADSTAAYYLYKEEAGYREVLKWNHGGFYYRYAFLLDTNRLPKVLAMFLLGFLAGRRRVYIHLAENRRLFQKLRFYGFVWGLPLSLAFAYFQQDAKSIPQDMAGILDTITYALSVVPLSLAYISSLCLWWLNASGKKVLQGIGPVGRMALTNYISQSLMGILLYYNLGLGLGVTFGPTLFIPMALGVFALQVVVSYWWLRHFEYGPLEWIWRQLTYGKRLPLQRKSEVVVMK